jgi:hypothetical protein
MSTEQNNLSDPVMAFAERVSESYRINLTEPELRTWAQDAIKVIRALSFRASASGQEAVGTMEWIEGEPPKPWRDEWFIALTIYGDRVVLRSLPEEYTYDYKTADETYIKAKNIKKWMQFPDSMFKPIASPVETEQVTK